MKVHFRSARNAVVAALLRHERLSRSEMSELVGVSPAAISEVTQDLLKKGVLEELATTSTGRSRGRPTIHLTLNASHAYFLGASASEITMPLVITDLCGRIVATHPLPSYKTLAEFTSAVRKTFSSLLRTSPISRNRIRGIGVAVSGIVDPHIGSCRYSAALNWRDAPVAEKISKALKLPVWVDNDANAIALAEKSFGHAREYQNFSSIILGRTIGSAHYMHNALYRGHNDGAGEIGHVQVEPKGPLCRCGRNGCLDMVAGGFALQRAAKECGLTVTTMRDLELLAMQGDTKAIRLLRRAGEALGTTAAILVHLNNPQCLLFTDMEGFEIGVFRTAVRQAIENNILPRFLGSTEILFVDAEPKLLPRSAASIAASEYLAAL